MIVDLNKVWGQNKGGVGLSSNTLLIEEGILKVK